MKRRLQKVKSQPTVARTDRLIAKPKKDTSPRRMTHCANKECRGVLHLVCLRMQFGARRFGISRRMLMRECVKCANRYIDRDCAVRNEIEVKSLEKRLTKRRVEEGLVDIDDNGKVWYRTKQKDNPYDGAELW